MGNKEQSRGGRAGERNTGDEQEEEQRREAGIEKQGKEYGRCRRGAWQETGAKQRERSRGEE